MNPSGNAMARLVRFVEPALGEPPAVTQWRGLCVRAVPAPQRLGTEELSAVVPGSVRQEARKREGAVVCRGGHGDDPEDDNKDDNGWWAQRTER